MNIKCKSLSFRLLEVVQNVERKLNVNSGLQQFSWKRRKNGAARTTIQTYNRRVITLGQKSKEKKIGKMAILLLK